MPIRAGDREQRIYVLDFTDAVEAVIQYIEAKTQQRLLRPTDAILNLDPEKKTLSLILTGPATVREIVPPPCSKEDMH